MRKTSFRVGNRCGFDLTMLRLNIGKGKENRLVISYSQVKIGDRLRVVGEGAPGYAKLGEVVTVTKTDGRQRVDVVRDDGAPAYFALTCGAARLEPELS